MKKSGATTSKTSNYEVMFGKAFTSNETPSANQGKS